MENLQEIVGKNLANLRKAKGLTQIELAAAIHYSDKSISKWELGYALPTVDILKDFASFYGVTLDYLVTPQEESSIQEVVKDQESTAKRINKAIILSMAIMVVVLIALSVFFSGYYFGEGRTPLWPVLIWAVPSTLLVSCVAVKVLYHNRIAFWVLVSTMVWAFLFAACCHFMWFADPPQNVWFVLMVGVPVQVMIILIINYRHVK